ncbi:MAG: glycogen synthase [SAR324 cluster bacterium]|nr:glycogen synthase [SAR324 cluster bacterium]
MSKKDKSKLKVLFITSELAGITKTGGLGDVSYALPKALKALRVDARVVMPFHSMLIKRPVKKILDSLIVKPGNVEIGCSIYETKIDFIQVYLVEHQIYFHRPRLYDDGVNEYPDNIERFCLLSAAALALAQKINFVPDCVHCNDWQAALAPLYLSRLKKVNSKFKKTKSLLTVHNGHFQGKHSAFYQGFLGLNEAFHMYAYEDCGHINLLKGGIFYSDYTNTVSPGYAEELLTLGGGHGLYMAYQQKKDRFLGILNGCSYEIWNPKTDKYIAKHYSINNLANKRHCKLDLVKQFGLKNDDTKPLIGMVSRLTEQKGFNYAIPAIYRLLAQGIMVAVVGDGDLGLVNSFHHLKYLFPDKLIWWHGYSEEMAHKIEAGCDLFLMPSLFEPCGLNQMYSQRYGSLPLVRSVGGLKDTVRNYDIANFQNSSGFVFDEPSAKAVYNTVMWGVDVYQNHRDKFLSVVKSAMAKRYYWRESAREYIKIYSA